MSRVVEMSTLDYRSLTEAHRQEIRDWLAALGEPMTWVFRIETEVIDAPMVRISRYPRGTDGRAFTDPETGEVAVEVTEILQRVEPPDWWGSWVTLDVRWPL